MSIPQESATQVATDKQVITNAETTSTETIDWEKRFKDTQSAYTKSRQELVEYKAKLKVLEDQTNNNPDIDDNTKRELDDLKYSNPDAWYNKMRELETSTERQRQEKYNSTLNQVTELERRKILLEEFQVENPDVVINDDVIDLDIPPRIKKKLEKGEVKFEDFLVEVRDYLKHPKRIYSPDTLSQPNLNKVGGDGQPTKQAIEKDIIQSYKDEIY